MVLRFLFLVSAYRRFRGHANRPAKNGRPIVKFGAWHDSDVKTDVFVVKFGLAGKEGCAIMRDGNRKNRLEFA